jgi:nucleoside-diphosphate kinase
LRGVGGYGTATFTGKTKGNVKMAIERTFSMIKPDATKRNLTGAITKMLEDAGLRVVASKRVWMSKREAEGFYAVHKERPFFGELVEGMTSGTDDRAGSGRRERHRSRTAKSWAPPTRPMPTKARSARRTPCRSAKTRFTVRTLRRPLPKKSSYWFSDTEIVG